MKIKRNYIKLYLKEGKTLFAHSTLSNVYYKYHIADSINLGLAFFMSILSWLDTGRGIDLLKFLTCSTGNTASTNNKLARGLNHRMRD